MIIIRLLQTNGPRLGRPHADTLGSRKYPNLKELRVQHAGNPYRVLFAFDPRRVAILLMGDRKADESWYQSAIPKAERLYQRYLKELTQEGLL